MAIEDMLNQDVENSTVPDIAEEDESTTDDPTAEVALEDFLSEIGVSQEKLADAASALESWKNGEPLHSVGSADEPMDDIGAMSFPDAKTEAISRAKKGY